MQDAGIEEYLCYGEDGDCSKGVCIVIFHEAKADCIDHVYGKVPHEAHDCHIQECYPQRPEEVGLTTSDGKEILPPEQKDCEESLQEDLISDIEELSVISK